MIGSTYSKSRPVDLNCKHTLREWLLEKFESAFKQSVDNDNDVESGSGSGGKGLDEFLAGDFGLGTNSVHTNWQGGYVRSSSLLENTFSNYDLFGDDEY